MKKKLVIVAALAAVMTVGMTDRLFASPVHPGGWGVGVLWGSSFGDNAFADNSNIALSLKAPAMPVFWGIRVGTGGGDLRLGLQGDVYILGSEIIPTLSWFLGVGAYGNIWLGDDFALGFGARLPIGLTWQPLNVLEIFLNVAPQLGGFLYTAGDGGFEFPDDGAGFFGFEIGVRVWF
ncbi:MAG: hypothetical protein FWB99_08670 [Treponema sp.]|nr:hypothetical protein [Treponema sp.]